MDEEDYFIRGIYQIYKEEIKGMGITNLHEAFDTEDQKKCLCKYINIKSFNNNSSLYNEFQKTANLHHKYQNNNITELLDIVKGTVNIYIFYNYIEGKTLYKYKKEGKNFSENEIKKILEEIMKAIIHLYKNKVILKDLKLENIFLTNDGKILLCNLEKSNLLSQTNKDFKIVNAYINISLKLGLVICKLLDYTNFISFLKENDIKNQKYSDLNLINQYVADNILNNEFISIPLKRLIKDLLKDEDNRIKINDITSHEYFRQIPQKENKIDIKSSIKSTKTELKNTKQNINTNNISRSTIADVNDINIKINKNIKEETIITDEAYLIYYKKEREVLLGLIDSFDENEIINNVKLAEKYEKEKIEKDKIKSIPEKKVIVNDNKDNNITNSTVDENEGGVNESITKQKRKKFLGIF
jgi:RNAse (barnase) inhibitor barstar